MEGNSKALADFKRLVEICQANPAWCEEFLREPPEWLERHRLDLLPGEAAQAIRAWIFREETDCQDNPYLAESVKIIEEIHAFYREKTSVKRFSNSGFQSWYQRQYARNRVQSQGMRHMRGLFLMPVTFELSDGCSVGCPFCCLAAKRLEKIFAYTPSNLLLWEEILRATKDVIGDIADTAACYFATEPLDNPDYERFLEVYKEVLGCFPQTTTAVSQRNVKRTKALLKEIGGEHLKRAAVRFSVTSLKQLEEIHRAFTSEELAYVEVLLNNPESVNLYSKSGRAIELAQELSDKGFADSISSVCVCGFVVNMACRTIMLAAPHRPDALHPLGMRVYETRTFCDAAEYRETLQQMMKKWMDKGLLDGRLLSMNEYVEVSYENRILTVRGDHVRRSFTMTEQEYRCFSGMLKEKKSLEKVTAECGLSGYGKERFRNRLKLLYDAGYIDDYDRKQIGFGLL